MVERQLQKQHFDTALVRLIAFGICNPPFPLPRCVARGYCARKIQFRFYSAFSPLHTHRTRAYARTPARAYPEEIHLSDISTFLCAALILLVSIYNASYVGYIWILFF